MQKYFIWLAYYIYIYLVLVFFFFTIYDRRYLINCFFTHIHIYKIDCSVNYCKTCTNDICSECKSSYYFYENISCSLICETTQGYYDETLSGSLYCKSKLIFEL